MFMRKDLTHKFASSEHQQSISQYTPMERITLLMLTASLSLTGTHRILMDLLERLDQKKFDILVAYKSEFQGPGNDLVPEIRELGIKIFPLRGRHLFDFRGLVDIHKIVSQHKVDIIHCWDSLSVVARFIGKFGGAKIIDSVGNPPVDMNWKEYMAKKVSSVFLNGVVFQSEGTQDLHHRYGANTLRWCKEKVIYNAVDLNKLPCYDFKTKQLIKKRYGFTRDDIILSNLGMYNAQKAQEYLIRALPSVLQRFNRTRLLLIGWGNRESKLRSEIQSLGLSDKVTVTGKKQKNEVFELLSVTDIYVSSSLWEGLPIAVLEAMAFEVPVVATDVVGNREALVNGMNGFLVPRRNPTALGEAILHLLDNPELKNHMGKVGRERVREIFTPEKFITQHQQFYQSIVKGT